jgi:hypothetical protein
MGGGELLEADLAREGKGSRWAWHDRGYWARGGLVGCAVMLVLFGLAIVLGGASTGAGPVGDAAAALTGAVTFGAVPGALVGLLADLTRRRRPPAPARVTVGELRHRAALPADDVWERMYQQCARSVRSAGDAVTLAPASPAQEWLAALHGRMAQELANARALAQLGRAAFPDERVVPSPAARQHRVYVQLRAAVDDFATSTQRVVDIAAQLVRGPNLDDVRTELAVLEVQLPVLSEPDLG